MNYSAFHLGKVHRSRARFPHWKHLIFNICTLYLHSARQNVVSKIGDRRQETGDRRQL
ncbi:MAG: hypothetical protein AB4080_12585 [Trichodesmium sp.]